ncbi:hypothetical protein R1sor_008090 [Riccia sorocarpa]|uniref:Reverse transcriptase zinc-binding domain-containing protein n=1 Tax=Riccia sorocarpa TaxID=122646 RepID=A0ABD3HVU4_9MARC
MNAQELKDPEVMRRVMLAWSNEPEKVKDDRRKSMRGWGRVKAVELLEALEGEDGELITSQEEIMDEIHQFYQRLYTAEKEGEENEMAREEVVGLISRVLEADESRKMAEIPTRKEVEAVVFAMKSEKAPGHDGLTVEMAKVLQMRYITAILDGSQVGWSWMFRRWCRYFLIAGPNKLQRHLWDCNDAMLLLKGMKVAGAGTFNRLMKIWFDVKKEVLLDKNARRFPEKLPIASLKWIWGCLGNESMEGWNKILVEARRKKIVRLQDLRDDTGRVLMEAHGSGEEGLQENEERIRQWLMQIEVIPRGLAKMTEWEWRGKGPVGEKWSKQNGFWTQILWKKEQVSFNKLTWKWSVEEDDMKWFRRWENLWGGSSLMRHKVWLWKIIQNGLPTGERAAKWGVTDGVCPFCSQQESIIHLFWECRRIQNRVQWMKQMITGGEEEEVTMMDAIDMALVTHRCQPGVAILLGEAWRITWGERNKKVFEDRTSRMPTRAIANAVEEQILAAIQNLEGRRGRIVQGNTHLFLEEMDRVTSQVDGGRGNKEEGRLVEMELQVVQSVSETAQIQRAHWLEEGSSDRSSSLLLVVRIKPLMRKVVGDRKERVENTQCCREQDR